MKKNDSASNTAQATLPAPMLLAADMAAARMGMSRSALVRVAVELYLRDLGDWPPRAKESK